jgi:hypothetical protein
MRKLHRLSLPVGIVLTGVLAATVALAAMAATARVADKPANTAAPTISGNATEGSTLTVNNGTWTGTGTITFAYQWRRCDASGANCSDIAGQTKQTYVLATADNNNTIRAVVTATNADGATPATTAQTAVIRAASSGGSGCPSGASGSTVSVADVSSPARLQIAQFQSSPAVIPGNMQSFSMKVRVGDTCGRIVTGAQVYVTAVPFNQVNIPAQVTTGSDGWASLDFSRQKGFPAATKQRLMVLFVRASKPGDPILAGISTRRLVSLRVNLKGVG